MQSYYELIFLNFFPNHHAEFSYHREPSRYELQIYSNPTKHHSVINNRTDVENYNGTYSMRGTFFARYMEENQIFSSYYITNTITVIGYRAKSTTS